MSPPNREKPRATHPGHPQVIFNEASLPLTRLESTPLKEIIALHGEILQAARTSLGKALRVGELLEDVKGGLEHGEWLPWVKSNLPFSERTARNYIRVYQERDRLKSATVADLTQAYRLLEEKKEDTAPVHSSSLGRFLRPESRFIPEAGQLLTGWVYSPSKGRYDIFIMPSCAPGFFHVSSLWSENKDCEVGSHVEGTKKPVRQDAVEYFLGRIVPEDILEKLELEAIPCDQKDYNMWLFNDYQDYVNKVILGHAV